MIVNEQRHGPPGDHAADERSVSGPPRPRRWIWPLPPVPAFVAQFVDRSAAWAGPLVLGWGWLPAAAGAGALPWIISYWLRLPGHQVASSLLLFPLFLASVREARPGRGLLILLVGFIAHSVCVIVLTVLDAPRGAPLLPGAEPFWEQSLAWVQTGHDPEYDPARWLPKHMLLLCAVVILAYCSLGLTVLLRGFYEVDLMNFYVGRLISQSSDTSTALVYGWHVWSLMRGVGCALVLYEVSAISFTALTGRDAGRERGRGLRLGAGIALLVVDGLLKLFLLHSVQARLQANLL